LTLKKVSIFEKLKCFLSLAIFIIISSTNNSVTFSFHYLLPNLDKSKGTCKVNDMILYYIDKDYEYKINVDLRVKYALRFVVNSLFLCINYNSKLVNSLQIEGHP
jgi:hypothetical protein